MVDLKGSSSEGMPARERFTHAHTRDTETDREKEVKSEPRTSWKSWWLCWLSSVAPHFRPPFVLCL